LLVNYKWKSEDFKKLLTTCKRNLLIKVVHLRL